jgi:hypothetical protein
MASAAVTLSLLTACGSTVQVQGSPTVGGDQAGLGTTAGPTTALGAQDGASAPALGSGSTAASGGSSSSGQRATTVQQGPAAPSTAVTSAPSVGTPPSKANLAPVRIGFTIVPDADAASKSFGATSNSGDQRAEVMAAVN